MQAAAGDTLPENAFPPPPDTVLGSSCTCAGKGRNLVVCIDGTSNKFGRKNTNVVELYSHLMKDEQQLTYYSSGIGTYAQPSFRSWAYWKQLINHKLDLAIAWNFDHHILGAYQWLSEQYRAGDRIFLFGFSRGAYQVRALSAMIEQPSTNQLHTAQIPFAYELFTAINPSEPDLLPEETPAGGEKHKESRRRKQIEEHNATLSRSKKMAKHFKVTFSRSVRVHFVGAWDTVSSVGLVRKKVLPYTACGMSHVCFFRHALALDECRVKFLPEYAYGGVTEKAGSADLTEGRLPHTKEVWFAGTHSDIGGGNSDNLSMDHSGPPLRWMAYEAVSARLIMWRFRGKWNGNKPINVNESLKGFWRVFETLPIKRLTYEDADGVTWRWTRRPQLGAGRRIQPGQKIHNSVFLAKAKAEDNVKALDYTPRSRLPPDIENPLTCDHRQAWSDLGEAWDGFMKNGGNFAEFEERLSRHQVSLEDDLPDLVADLLAKLKDPRDYDQRDGPLLRRALLTDDGRALKMDPGAVQHIHYLFWDLIDSIHRGTGQDARNSSKEQFTDAVVISPADDIDLFALLLDYHARRPNDDRTVAFGPREYHKEPTTPQLELRLKDHLITFVAFDPFTPPLTHYTTQITSEIDLRLPLSWQALHNHVSGLKHFLCSLRCGHKESDLQTSVDVDFRGLNTNSRVIPLNGYPPKRSYLFELSQFVTGGSSAHTQYGIKLTNRYGSPLHLSIFAFHYGALKIHKLHQSSEDKPLGAEQTLDIIDDEKLLNLWPSPVPGILSTVTYLKIFLSTRYFEWTFDTMSPLSSTTSPLFPPDSHSWDAITIAMVGLPPGKPDTSQDRAAAQEHAQNTAAAPAQSQNAALVAGQAISTSQVYVLQQQYGTFLTGTPSNSGNVASQFGGRVYGSGVGGYNTVGYNNANAAGPHNSYTGYNTVAGNSASYSNGVYNGGGGGYPAGAYTQNGGAVAYSNAPARYNNASVPYHNAAVGYSNAQPGYNNMQAGYTDAQAGYSNASMGYNNVPTGYNNMQAAYNNAPGNYSNTQVGYSSNGMAGGAYSSSGAYGDGQAAVSSSNNGAIQGYYTVS